MMDKKEKENKLMEKALKLFTEKGLNNMNNKIEPYNIII